MKGRYSYIISFLIVSVGYLLLMKPHFFPDFSLKMLIRFFQEINPLDNLEDFKIFYILFFLPMLGMVLGIFLSLGCFFYTRKMVFRNSVYFVIGLFITLNLIALIFSKNYYPLLLSLTYPLVFFVFQNKQIHT